MKAVIDKNAHHTIFNPEMATKDFETLFRFHNQKYGSAVADIQYLVPWYLLVVKITPGGNIDFACTRGVRNPKLAAAQCVAKVSGVVMAFMPNPRSKSTFQYANTGVVFQHFANRLTSPSGLERIGQGVFALTSRGDNAHSDKKDKY